MTEAIAVAVVIAVISGITALALLVADLADRPRIHPRHSRRFDPGDLDISRLDRMDGVGRQDEP